MSENGSEAGERSFTEGTAASEAGEFDRAIQLFEQAQPCSVSLLGSCWG